MGRKPTKVTAERVINAFKELYFENTGNQFNPNYGMIVMAEKLAGFYTMPQLLDAMIYYFEVMNKHDFYKFMYEIDFIIKSKENQAHQDEMLQQLEHETSLLVRKIHDSRRGEAS